MNGLRYSFSVLKKKIKQKGECNNNNVIILLRDAQTVSEFKKMKKTKLYIREEIKMHVILCCFL